VGAENVISPAAASCVVAIAAGQMDLDMGAASWSWLLECRIVRPPQRDLTSLEDY